MWNACMMKGIISITMLPDMYKLDLKMNKGQ